MAILFGVLAVGLGFAAWRVADRNTRIFLIACGLLNAFGAIAMVVTHDPYAFRLHPNNGHEEPDYRSDDG